VTDPDLDIPDEPYPRVVFISINPFSQTSNNGKTFASFFEGYPREAIAQLYFHRELPSSPVTDNYFRITEEALLGNVFRPWRVQGERVGPTSTSTRRIPERAHTTLKGSPTARLLRQVLWTGLRLENSDLIGWLDEFRPEVLMFCGGNATALYPKVAALASRYSAKVVLYVTDDYVLPSRTPNVSARIARLWNRREFVRFARHADLVLTIGERMSATYVREFGVESVPVMNMVPVPSAPPAPRHRASDETYTLMYAGSLHSNRWRVLEWLGGRIRVLADQGVRVRLKLYGPEPSPEALQAVHNPPYSAFLGLLSPAELAEQMDKAHALVHVEAADPASIEVTRLSVSTKIPEYLASGRSILAIGPGGVASIDYLAENGVAQVVHPGDAERLDEALLALVRDGAEARDQIGRAFKLAQKNHDGDRIRESLWRRLSEIAGSS